MNENWRKNPHWFLLGLFLAVMFTMPAGLGIMSIMGVVKAGGGFFNSVAQTLLVLVGPIGALFQVLFTYLMISGEMTLTLVSIGIGITLGLLSLLYLKTGMVIHDKLLTKVLGPQERKISFLQTMSDKFPAFAAWYPTTVRRVWLFWWCIYLGSVLGGIIWLLMPIAESWTRKKF